MNITDIPSPNFWYDPRPVKAIVLHGTSGALQGSIGWLCNKKSGVSASFVISKSGSIYRLVDPERGRKAWANGIPENWDTSIKWLNDAIRDKVNLNRITWSIEHEALCTEMETRASMTDAQFNSSIDLTAYLLKLAGLKASHETIIGHNQISGVQKYNCPGVIFPPAYTEVLLTRYPTLR